MTLPNNNLVSCVPDAKSDGITSCVNVRMDDTALKNAIEEALARKVIFQFDDPQELADQILKNDNMMASGVFLNFVIYLIKLHSTKHAYYKHQYYKELDYVASAIIEESARIKRDVIVEKLQNEGQMTNEDT